MWACCRDVDRLATLMCYVQLSLLHIPAAVIVGNSLALEVQEVFYTPAHYPHRWDDRLAVRRAGEAMKQPERLPALPHRRPLQDPSRTRSCPPPSGQHQFDFGF